MNVADVVPTILVNEYSAICNNKSYLGFLLKVVSLAVCIREMIKKLFEEQLEKANNGVRHILISWVFNKNFGYSINEIFAFIYWIRSKDYYNNHSKLSQAVQMRFIAFDDFAQLKPNFIPVLNQYCKQIEALLERICIFGKAICTWDCVQLKDWV